MMIIKEAADAIRGNISESRRYITRAYALRETQPEMAAWFRKMANEHLMFNTEGHTVVTALINAARAAGERNELVPGMMAVYEQLHGELVAEQAEVASMISAYK